ncbi:Neuroblastoma-amplified sequence [Dissostichus eleginoides]|uniref:Neuroblastoma-amplified sequence n=1 Tax=Dissostichus eleginoides TaxID=100907 RepID=A0AAD9BQR1_DISEL|nr:Neuroblastoma-amplified sequence [Dissostichus eleginoides]
MAEESLIEGEDENILYDLLVINAWPAETDTQLRGNKEHNTSVIAKAVTGPFRLVLHYLWYSSCLPLGLVRLAHKQINWQLVLASNGKLLAVVQDQCVEIRSVRDDFGSIIGKCQALLSQQIGKTVAYTSIKAGFMIPSPFLSASPPFSPSLIGSVPGKLCVFDERRHGATTAPCWATLDSTGTVRLFDRIGSELFVIPPSVSFPGDFSCAVAGLIFLEYTGSAHWSAELLVITYGGGLKSYLPGFDEINPEWKTSLERRKKIKDKEQYYPLEDVSWWSDVVLILARCSGSVTVSSVRTLRNLLGKSCEWFEPSPRVTAAHEVVFLSLEVDVRESLLG